MRVLLLHSYTKMAFACFVCRRLNHNSFIFEGFAYVPKTMLIKVSGIPHGIMFMYSVS